MTFRQELAILLIGQRVTNQELHSLQVVGIPANVDDMLEARVIELLQGRAYRK